MTRARVVCVLALVVLLFVPALMAAPGSSAEATKTVLAPLPSQISAGEPISLTASVSGRDASSGRVTFYDGDTAIASVAVDASGTATTKVTLKEGSHNLKASYAGNGAASSSTPVVALAVVITPTLSNVALAALAVVLAAVALWAAGRSSLS